MQLKKEKWVMQILEKVDGAIAVIKGSTLQQGLAKLPQVKKEQSPIEQSFRHYFGNEDPFLYTNRKYEKIFMAKKGKDALVSRIFEIQVFETQDIKSQNPHLVENRKN